VFFVLELAAMALLLLVPLPIPALIPLLVGATLDLSLRGRSWAAVGLGGKDFGRHCLLGAAIGLAVASVLYFVASASTSSTLLLEGNTSALLPALLLAAAWSAATEMVFRGFVIGSMHHLWGSRAALVGVFVAGLFSALATGPSSSMAAMGALLYGVGYGLLYLAGRRSLALPMAAHMAIEMHTAVVEFGGW
jgi:membrane protease YdiL (CAAX protease family)